MTLGLGGPRTLCCLCGRRTSPGPVVTPSRAWQCHPVLPSCPAGCEGHGPSGQPPRTRSGSLGAFHSARGRAGVPGQAGAFRGVPASRLLKVGGRGDRGHHCAGRRWRLLGPAWRVQRGSFCAPAAPGARRPSPTKAQLVGPNLHEKVKRRLGGATTPVQSPARWGCGNVP